MVAHRTAIDAGVTKQGHLLYDIAVAEANVLLKKSNSDLQKITNYEFRRLIFSQQESGKIEIDQVYGSNLEQLSPSEISGMLANNKNHGTFTLNEERSFWAVAHIPSSNKSLLLIYRDQHQQEAIKYEGEILARLIITALIIVWIAIWVALVVSKRIVYRLNEQSSALIYQATYDKLTALPNRSLLFKELEEHIALSNYDNNFTIFVLDVDRFKEVNDTIGHDNGDKLLKQLAERFVVSLTSKVKTYRLGGDEFAILFFEQRASAIKRLIREIVQILSKPFTLEGINLPIDVSIGSASYPRDACDASTLIKIAEVAMYQAKTQHATYLPYDEKYNTYSIKRLTLMGELRNAMNDQIVLYYQPKADLAQLKTTSVEALVRWLHPEHGLIPPDDFISIAENSGMMNELTLRIIEIAMAQSREWNKQGLSIQIAINLSVINLLDKNLPQQVQSLLNTYQVDVKFIKFEITESSLMSNPELALSTLKALDKMNISLSIDDFGTGYSSLSYLKQLPVSELKIDRSFVKDMMNDEDDKVIVKSTIELAHNMNCSVVAEGIEDKLTYNYLIELGCDTAQGYYLSRPLPAEQLTEWFNESQWPPT
jgi:diguanylate cyclase (GGDEF)-like protein